MTMPAVGKSKVMKHAAVCNDVMSHSNRVDKGRCCTCADNIKEIEGDG